jgi:hypothetical protein
MKRSTVPIAIAALLPMVYGVRKLVETKAHEKNEMNQLLGDHFKDDYKNLKLTSHQRKEICSVLKNKAADANHDIKHILNTTQLSLYEKIRNKLH